MKILELRFKNLNSLYGEWLIDFTDPEYTLNGIFALTGPTGAGKSTVLDAICLALYGATPRLGRITKSANDIMSRQTGECYAEVLFESQAGIYRCHWEQRRARKSASGRLQDQEHHISEGLSGKLIETKKSLVSAVIEEKTGMDFDRFTRSILLAQGGFDTFLKADVEQKSRILEQITGTEIYSEISRRVHERQRGEREKLNIFLAEISGINILETEQEQELIKQLSVSEKQAADQQARADAVAKAITWLNTVQNLRQEIQDLSQGRIELTAEIEAFKPDRTRLELANKAAGLDSLYASLQSGRSQQSTDKKLLKEYIAILPEQEKLAQQSADKYLLAEKNVQNARQQLNDLNPKIRQVRLLDQSIQAQIKQINQENTDYKLGSEKLSKNRQLLADSQAELGKINLSLQQINHYLKNNKNDEWLIANLVGIEQQLASLMGDQQKLNNKKTELDSVIKMLASVSSELKKLKQNYQQMELEQKQHDEKLSNARLALKKTLAGKLLREYRTEQTNLLREQAFRLRIAELEEQRARLIDGQPCPLCGSLEHPFAQANVPVLDAIDEQLENLEKLIIQAETQEEHIQKIEQSLTNLNQKLVNSQTQLNNAINNESNINEKQKQINRLISELETDFEKQKQLVLGKLRPFDIGDIPANHIESILMQLKTRLKNWQNKQQQKSDVEKQITDINGRIIYLNKIISAQTDDLDEKQNKLQLTQNELNLNKEKRYELFGDKNPDTEENSLNQAISVAEKEVYKLNDLNRQQQQKLLSLKTNIESLDKRILHRIGELEKEQNNFLHACKKADFLDEQAYLEARLHQDERDLLSNRAKYLDLAINELNAKQKDRQNRLDLELAKNITQEPIESLEPQLEEYQRKLKALGDEIAGIRHKLAENKLAQEKIKAKQTDIENQKKECSRWEKLHGLIGSADGKKYRNFAQGLTFELMVSHANRQLEKMTDRYLLIRDDNQPLELNVVDNYQAGEIRSTRNLSGGESFIVSLTLALGLSKMASRKVRVDSLFLDEGFGTLDEDALEIALESLASLNQDGKLIGIISHVSALKERISTQINIKPASGGKSMVIGPGCRHIAS